MSFIKLIPFAGVALAAVDGKVLTNLDDSASLYGASANAIIESLENANATASGSTWFADNFRANETDALSWEGSVRLSVAAHVPVPKTGANQVTQLAGLSIIPHNQTTADEYPADVCVTVVQGLNEELTEQSQEWENNSCDMIPKDCRGALSDVVMDNVDRNGCTGKFSLPAACADAFPDGLVSTFTVQTDRLPDGGYIFAHASTPAESGSDKASDAYAKTLKSIWPVYIANMENMQGNLDNPVTHSSLRCLRAHQFLRGSQNPNEKQEEEPANNEANEDENTPGSGVGRIQSLSLSGLFTAVAAVSFLF